MPTYELRICQLHGSAPTGGQYVEQLYMAALVIVAELFPFPS